MRGMTDCNSEGYIQVSRIANDSVKVIRPLEERRYVMCRIPTEHIVNKRTRRRTRKYKNKSRHTDNEG